MPVRLTRTLHVCRLMWRRYSKTSMTSKKMYTDMLDDHTLIRMRKRVAASGQSKFITPEITKAIRERSSVKRKFRKTRKTNDWEAYRVLRNRMRWKSVIKHFDHLCHSRAGNFRTLWQSLRPLLPRKCAQNDFTILKENSRTIWDQTQVAEIFNHYFANITDRLATDSHKFHSNISHMPLAYLRIA